jgi:hypothetical protein
VKKEEKNIAKEKKIKREGERESKKTGRKCNYSYFKLISQ